MNVCDAVQYTHRYGLDPLCLRFESVHTRLRCVVDGWAFDDWLT